MVYIVPIGSLSAVEVLATTRFEVNAERRPQTYQWEGHGLSLHVSKGTSASFTIRAVWSSKFKLPKGTELVSPVYWVSCEGVVGGPVGVELQHSTRVGEKVRDLFALKFAVCKVEKAEPPYQFDLSEGQFSTVSSYGRLEVVSSSTLLAILWYKPWQSDIVPMFQARLYYHKQKQSTILVHFVIVPKHEMSTKVRAVQKLFYSQTLLYTVFRCCNSVMTTMLSSFLVLVRRWCSKMRLYHCSYRDPTILLRAQ